MSEIRLRVQRNERVLATTLTKKMAEDLTEYLEEHDIRVRYLHSDVETVERIEIIRDLRLGEFDVLVGINLLREGLDIPEVSLVAILDADKEGFLRSTRSLIQTIGRAARNINGKAILYGDSVSDSMREAIDETNRRRIKQSEYNRVHNITPKALNKKVVDVLQLEQESKAPNVSTKKQPLIDKLSLESFKSAYDVVKEIEKLAKQMKQCAKELEFEKAALIRDQIKELEEYMKLNLES